MVGLFFFFNEQLTAIISLFPVLSTSWPTDNIKGISRKPCVILPLLTEYTFNSLMAALQNRHISLPELFSSYRS